MAAIDILKVITAKTGVRLIKNKRGELVLSIYELDLSLLEMASGYIGEKFDELSAAECLSLLNYLKYIEPKLIEALGADIPSSPEFDHLQAGTE